MTGQPSFGRLNYSSPNPDESPHRPVPGHPAPHERSQSGRARLGRCRQAAQKGQLVLKVDFGVSLAFSDARYHKDHELHEIIYWDAAELQEEPGLFEGVIKKAVEWNAQLIYTIDPAASDAH